MTQTAGSPPKLYKGALPVPDEIAGARVVVRPFLPGNLAAFHEALEESREHLLPWLPWAHGHRTAEETLDFFAHSRAAWIGRDGFGGGLFLHSGRLLGGIGLHPRSWQVPSFEIGYWLRLSATGQGYMTEAVALMTRLAYEVLGANRVFIRCDAQNERSRRVAERSGYVFEGRHRRDTPTGDGSLRDTLHFSLLREEYEALLPSWQTLFGPAQ